LRKVDSHPPAKILKQGPAEASTITTSEEAPPAPAPAPDKKVINETESQDAPSPGTANGGGENLEGQVIEKIAKAPASEPTPATETPAPAVEAKPADTKAEVETPEESTLPPGVPTGVPMGVPMAMPAGVPTGTPTSISASNDQQPATTDTSATSASSSETVVEKCDLPTLYVGRIIGKGGEQIRDLQARAACKIDVDQNVPHGAPRIITYQGPRDKIEFAKSLVQMLCSDNWKNVDLPLGFATRIKLQVPSTVIGKIIGRGGEMIKVSRSFVFAKLTSKGVYKSNTDSCLSILSGIAI
jgi:predicted RNA-binding protein YlqC (UPF0109 family)